MAPSEDQVRLWRLQAGSAAIAKLAAWQLENPLDGSQRAMDAHTAAQVKYGPKGPVVKEEIATSKSVWRRAEFWTLCEQEGIPCDKVPEEG